MSSVSSVLFVISGEQLVRKQAWTLQEEHAEERISIDSLYIVHIQFVSSIVSFCICILSFQIKLFELCSLTFDVAQANRSRLTNGIEGKNLSVLEKTMSKRGTHPIDRRHLLRCLIDHSLSFRIVEEIVIQVISHFITKQGKKHAAFHFARDCSRPTDRYIVEFSEHAPNDRSVLRPGATVDSLVGPPTAFHHHLEDVYEMNITGRCHVDTLRCRLVDFEWFPPVEQRSRYLCFGDQSIHLTLYLTCGRRWSHRTSKCFSWRNFSIRFSYIDHIWSIDRETFLFESRTTVYFVDFVDQISGDIFGKNGILQIACQLFDRLCWRRVSLVCLLFCWEICHRSLPARTSRNNKKVIDSKISVTKRRTILFSCCWREPNEMWRCVHLFEQQKISFE